jgi:hypothetical protein
MVPLCPRCHAILHRGHFDLASDLLDEVLRWYESVHRKSFGYANADLGIDTTSAGILEMYGSFVPD